MKKPAIPALSVKDTATRNALAPMKEILEQLVGARGGRIAALPTTATTAEIISKINEILEKLQDE